jgi:uncharacterized protein YerC
MDRLKSKDYVAFAELATVIGLKSVYAVLDDIKDGMNVEEAYEANLDVGKLLMDKLTETVIEKDSVLTKISVHTMVKSIVHIYDTLTIGTDVDNSHLVICKKLLGLDETIKILDEVEDDDNEQLVVLDKMTEVLKSDLEESEYQTLINGLSVIYDEYSFN